MEKIVNICTIIMGVIVAIAFIIGVIGVIVEKKRKGHGWIGQGFGK